MAQSKQSRMESHGWFTTEIRPGDRTLAQQMTGLSPLLREVPGRTVLDIGCAEGLIDFELAHAGAERVLGVDVVTRHVAAARTLRPKGLDCEFIQVDANIWHPNREYDVVLMLALLHKLRDPSAAAVRFSSYARELCVIRHPTLSEIIVDDRSGGVPHDIGQAMRDSGFLLERTEPGPFLEAVFYYRRARDGHR